MTDELTPIADYMAHEINTNSRGTDCRRMASLNAVSSRSCVAEYFRASWWRQLFGTLTPQQCMDIEISSHQAALMMWTMKVRQDAEWDHKPKLRTRFLSRANNSHVWFRYASVDYYYDIWSNIHYGYVGAAAGFDEAVLLDGAGLEQIGTDLLRRRWPRRSQGIDGLRAYDDPSDRASISMGMELYAVVPSHVSAKELVDTILMTAGLDTRPAVP